ncbi:uncharacterized protein ISCGN_017063 [Ixodes scapularis]
MTLPTSLQESVKAYFDTEFDEQEIMVEVKALKKGSVMYKVGLLYPVALLHAEEIPLFFEIERIINVRGLWMSCDNELDGEELFNLTDDMIKTLFPTMKSQLRFIRARKDLREESSANAAEPEALPLIVELGSTQDPPTDTWPSVYKLPPFPPALQRGLVEKDRSLFKPGQSRLRTMLVRALAEDITKYSLYPSKTQYSDVFATLGARYPFLKDKDTGRCGSISSNKCEDEASIRHHIAVMKEETAKVAADMDLIRDRMKRTFKTRQDLILRETGVRTVIEEFPAVTLPGMLLQDAKLAFGKDFLEDMRTKMKTFEVSTLLFLKGKNSPLDFQELIEEDPEKVALFNLPLIFNEKRQLLFTTEIVTVMAQLQMATTVLDVAEKRVEKATWDILERVDTCSTEDQHLMTTLAFLVTLPRSVRKQTAPFTKVVAPWFSKYPSVIWSGGLDDVGLCMVQVEDQLIKADHPVHAILVAFCLHWVADICYQPGARGF